MSKNSAKGRAGMALHFVGASADEIAVAVVELDDSPMHVTIPGVLRDPQARDLGPGRAGDLGKGRQKELVDDISKGG